MPRKAELQAEENAVNSPLRRSSRITISTETTVKSIKTRRSSTSSENTDTQEKSESKPIRARRGSVTKDEPEKKSAVLTRRRSSVTEESQTDTPKSIRSRRGSASEKNDGKESNVKDEIKKATHSHRPKSVEVESSELNEKSTVKTRRQSLDSEENPPEIKRITRSRRSSVDKTEDAEPQTPKITKNKKKLETLVDKKAVVVLTPVKRKPDQQQQGDMNLSVIEELSFTEERIPDETETSIHDTDSKQMVDSNIKSEEKLTPPQRKSPRLSRGADMSKKLEFTEDKKIKKINLKKDIDVTQETKETDVNSNGKVTTPETKSNLDKSVKLSEDKLDSADEIRGRNSISNTQTEESIGSTTANFNLLNKESLPEVEDPDKSPINCESNKDISSLQTRTIESSQLSIRENNLNDSIYKETVPATSQSSNEIEVVEDNTELSQTPTSKTVLSLSNDQLDSEDKIHSNGSVSLILHESKEEHILNTSSGSNNSDKENICKLDHSSTNLLKTKDELKLISQEVRVQRVSNVFRPNQIDYSFVEPMEVDEKSMLNDTRNKTVVDLDETNVCSSNYDKSGRKSTDDSIDESFNLCLNVTNSEQGSMLRKSQSQNELDEIKKKDSPSEGKVDIEAFELSNQYQKMVPTVEKQIQEESKHNLLLQNDEVKIDDSSDYEFNLETDEDELDPEGKRERKYIENKSGDISSQISITEKDTDKENDVLFKDKTETEESIIVADENNVKIKNINQVENSEHVPGSNLTHLKTDIHLKESKHVEADSGNPLDVITEKSVSSMDKHTSKHIDEKSVDASCLSANDGCENKGHYDISNQQLSKEDNETAITNKSDLDAINISEEQNKISETMDNTEKNAQSNTNKYIALITNNTEIENINEFDSNLRQAKKVDNKNIKHAEESEILIKNSTCLENFNDVSEESKSTSDLVIFIAEEIVDSKRNQVDKLTIIADNNDETIQKIILKAEENNKNCYAEDTTIEVKNNEITTELVPPENNQYTEENNIKQVESSTICEIENVESPNLEIISQDHGSKEKSNTNKSKNIEQPDNSKNDNFDGNLSVSRDITTKSCSKDESKVHLHDLSSQFAVGRLFSVDNSKNDTEVGLNENIGLTISDEKLNSAELTSNSAETTKVINKDQNIESDSEQNDLLLKERNESRNKIKKVKKHKTKKTKQNLESQHARIETENLSKSKLDIFLDKRLPELCQESDDYEGDFEKTNERNDFIDDMAEEGEEDTPSEDSNQIIEEGESINSTESEIDSDEDYDDNDSFICDDEEIELLSGEEYDLGQENAKKNKKSRIINVENYENEDVQIKKNVTAAKKKERNSRIIDVEDCDDDVISIDKIKMKKPKTGISPIIDVEDSDDDIKIESETKMQTTKCPEDSSDDEISFSKARKKEVQKNPAYTRKSSITVHENISVTEINDAGLSQRINSLVDSFCSKIEKGDISLNLSLEYDGQSKSNVSVLTEKHSNLKNANMDEEVIAEPPRKKRRVNSDLDNSVNQSSNNVIGVVNRKRKKRQDHEDRPKKKNKTKDLHTESFSLMNQLITDVKNRPLRTVKPSTSKVDMNNSWIVDVAEIKPSTSVVTKRDIDLYKKKKLHPKDFRQQMLNDSSRVQRMETKVLLKKRGAYK